MKRLSSLPALLDRLIRCGSAASPRHPAPAEQATVTYIFDWPQGIPWTEVFHRRASPTEKPTSMALRIRKRTTPTPTRCSRTSPCRKQTARKIFELGAEAELLPGRPGRAHQAHCADRQEDAAIPVARRCTVRIDVQLVAKSTTCKQLTQLFTGIANDHRLRTQAGIPVSLRQTGHVPVSERTGRPARRSRRWRSCT